MDLLLYIILASVSGFICYAIGKDKMENSFLWGLLGFLGIIIVAILVVAKDNNLAKTKATQKINNLDTNKYQKIEDLFELKKKGVLTDEEFEEEKSKLLKW